MTHPLSVLIVEDAEDDALLVVLALERSGYTVTWERVETAATMQTALGQPWDVIIADYSLPRFSGLAALALVQQHRLDIPFLVVSGTIGEDVAVAAMKAGAHDYVMKNHLARLGPAVARELQEAMIRQERQQAAAALQESEARYRTLFENAHDLIYTYDLTGRFTSLNRMGEQITGYTRDEVLTMRLSDLVAPEHLPLARQLTAGKLVGTPSSPYEVDIVTKSGRRATLEVSSQLIMQAGRPVGVQGIARDITARKHLEAQLYQAQKMEALGTLAGGIAHDFNNILTAILGYTELAIAGVPLESPSWHHLHAVLRASERATELVRQILTFSRRTQQEHKPIQLHLLIEETLKLLRATLPSTIEIRQNLDATTGTVLVDPTQMHQVLMNLCTNAEHSMRETGGVLEVCLDAITFPIAGASPPLDLRPGPYVRLTVRDTGHGMLPEILEHIFEPFFTTKGCGEGTGMGLAVVHGIIASHGGVVTVESAPGHGTTFVVYLPQGASLPAVTVPPEVPVPQGHESILFVDDEEALVSLGQELLTQLGYQVTAYSSSVEALEAFRVAPERFDLVITDQTMPHLTGESLARALRRIRPDIPILLCTGFSHTMTAEKARALGIDAFCFKPFVIHDLGHMIRHVLTQRMAQKGVL